MGLRRDGILPFFLTMIILAILTALSTVTRQGHEMVLSKTKMKQYGKESTSSSSYFSCGSVMAAIDQTAINVSIHPCAQEEPDNKDSTGNNIDHSENVLPLPMQVLRDYQQWHSRNSLLQDDPERRRHRTYTIGFYSCPLQAGNRLHHFFNAFIWAIVTNRTLLWHYYDRKVCLVFGRHRDRGICRSANTAIECSTTLQRADWLPSHDEWKETLNIPPLDRPCLFLDGTVTNVTVHSTTERSGQQQHCVWEIPRENVVVLSGRTNHLSSIDTQSALSWIVLPDMLGQDAATTLHSSTKRQLLLASESARQRAQALLALGVDFVYGMLFREIFQLQPEVTKDVRLPFPMNNPEVFSVGLHSRHSNESADGSDITAEIRCIEQVMAAAADAAVDQYSQQYAKCMFLLVSDRPATLLNLVRYIKQLEPSFFRNSASVRNCTPVWVPHKDLARPLSWRREHGPYAGAAFYQDLAMVVQARSAWIGTARRTSSLLLREILVYDRFREEQQRQSSEIYVHRQQQLFDRSLNDSTIMRGTQYDLLMCEF